MNQNVKTCESSKIINGIYFFGNKFEIKILLIYYQLK